MAEIETTKTFESLVSGIDFVELNSQMKALEELKQKLNFSEQTTRNAITGILDVMSSFCDTVVDSELVPEEYVRPEDGLTVVTWPESQNYMCNPNFQDEALLINDEYGLAKYGSSAYWIPNDMEVAMGDE